MKEFKPVFSRKLIIDNINLLDTFDEVKDYFTNLLYVYFEIYFHESDSDIENYLSKYGLNKTSSIDNSTLEFVDNFNHRDLQPARGFKYLSHKFNRFQEEMSSLIVFTRFQLTLLNDFLQVLRNSYL